MNETAAIPTPTHEANRILDAMLVDSVKAEKTATVTGSTGRFSTARQSHDARAWTASGDVD